MPNDARFGLVCGVGLVIAVAVVFFRREVPALALPSGPAAIGKPDDSGNPPPQPSQRAPIPAVPTGLTREQSFQPLPTEPASEEKTPLAHTAVRPDGPPPIGLIPNGIPTQASPPR